LKKAGKYCEECQFKQPFEEAMARKMRLQQITFHLNLIYLTNDMGQFKE